MAVPAGSALISDGGPTVMTAYPRLAHGVSAAQARAGKTVTHFDGWIGADADLDPRRSPGLVLSPSRLEELADCPLRYFFHHVLAIAPPEELAFDIGRWLDPASRGQLLHKIFESFLRDLRDEGVGRPGPEHLDRLLALTDKLAAQWRSLVPPPSEAVFAAERAELLRSVSMFLRAKTSGKHPGVPSYFELGFGSGDLPEPGEPGYPDPVPIPTASGGLIRLRGRIDRVDKSDGSQYTIWDYKTSSTWGYDEEAEYFKRGRQIQHGLYAIAAEEILRQTGADPAARVTSAGYCFPSEKGEGARVLRQQDRRAELGELLDHLADLAHAGLFVAAEDAYGCKYCEYKLACGGKRAADQTMTKLEAGDELAVLRRLKEYA